MDHHPLDLDDDLDPTLLKHDLIFLIHIDDEIALLKFYDLSDGLGYSDLRFSSNLGTSYDSHSTVSQKYGSNTVG
jgi:hypothetical protein